jgi:hypothetical protein
MQDQEIKVFQSKMEFKDNHIFLIRIFVNVLKEPNLVVTAYRTSKIDKYWL